MCSSMARKSCPCPATRVRKGRCTGPAALSPPPSPRNSPPAARSLRRLRSPKPTSPKPLKRVIPLERGACRSITSTVCAWSHLPAALTRFHSTACIPPPNPRTEGGAHCEHRHIRAALRHFEARQVCTRLQRLVDE